MNRLTFAPSCKHTMSDPIKHECGLAFIRLRKPFSYYQQQYGSVLWGLTKLYLLMEKQHNRGQDGAGIATVKLKVEAGYPFMNRMRSNEKQAIADIFQVPLFRGLLFGKYLQWLVFHYFASGS